MTWFSACSRGPSKPTDEPSPCNPLLQSCTYSKTVSELRLLPGEETGDICQSWILHNDRELLVTEVGMTNEGGYHHSNWFFVPVGAYDVPEGTWDCDKYGFEQFEAGVKGGFLYAQSTQSRAEVQRFPVGAAVRIPPHSMIIGNTHVRNTTDDALSTRMRLRLDTAPPDQVNTLLTPGRFSYFDLHIPPGSRARFVAECDLAATYREVMGEPWKYTLYYVLPHYHERGVLAELAIMGGPHDGTVLYRHQGFGGNLGHAFEPPVDIAALDATGLRFTCGHENPTGETVEWGIHGDEMCVFALFAETSMGFDAKVPEGSGRVAFQTEHGEIVHTGPCEIRGVPWTAKLQRR